MKDTYYFPHDYNSRNDLKIQALLDDYGASGYGIFWAITEILHEEENHILSFSKLTFKAIAKQMSTSVDQVEDIVKSCLEYGLFVMNGSDEFYSERVDENIGKRDEISKLRSKAGKISAENRKKQTDVQQELTQVEHNSTKERKIKEIKEKDIKVKKNNNNDFVVFWEHYPRKVGKIDAEKAWIKTKDRPDIQTIIESIEAHKKTEQWQKDGGQYIPHPATFISRGGWFDEIEAKPEININRIKELMK